MNPLFAAAALPLAAIALALPGNATGPENTIATPDMIADFERGLADQ